MFRSAILCVSVVCTLAIASTARASVIAVDGGTPDHNNAFFADTDYSWTAAANSTFPFTLIDPTTIIGANWWGGCVQDAGGGRSAAETTGAPADCSAVPEFTITLHNGTANAGETPGPVVASFVLTPTQTETGALINGTVKEYAYSVSFGPLLLAPGDYLFGLSANLGGNLTWGWETTAFGEGQHFQFNASDNTDPNEPINTWRQPTNVLAFNLIGPDAEPPTPTPVPEPATLSLLGLGLAGAAIRKRRARANR